MKTYNVIIKAAADADLLNLALFLRKLMSIEGAWKYHQNMLNEVQSLSILADIYPPSRYAYIRRYHPHARRMVSHNRRWVYIFHIEGDMVMVDRILPSKLIKE